MNIRKAGEQYGFEMNASYKKISEVTDEELEDKHSPVHSLEGCEIRELST